MFKTAGCAFWSIAFMILSSAAWVTHVVHCLTHGQWGFLIAGAVMFPIAIVHGIGLWLGFFV